MDQDPFHLSQLPWIDRPELAPETLLKSGSERLMHWREKGYVTLPQAVDTLLIDRYLEDLEDIWKCPEKYAVLTESAQYGLKPTRQMTREQMSSRLLRLIDFHASSIAGRMLSLSPPIISFLEEIFRDEVVGMQTLTFKYGSQQLVHQDHAYVVAKRPAFLAASWIALEDVTEEAGPVAVYPGSHLIPKFDFGDGPFLKPESSKREADFARHIHSHCESRGISKMVYLPKKGDVLIWHASVGHEGIPVVNPDLTRWSLVTHYSTPNAFPRNFPKWKFGNASFYETGDTRSVGLGERAEWKELEREIDSFSARLNRVEDFITNFRRTPVYKAYRQVSGAWKFFGKNPPEKIG